jgi:receptor-interacting serine/threonine-protein kinase 5
LTAEDDVKLTDVGQTRRESEISGTRCGTGCYSAPEILAGLTHACSADIFSLGMLLWELWYGKTAQQEIEMALGDVIQQLRRCGWCSCSGG